jgi:BirA family biotin operon repressor/biotin-[acetyl-CoA-carboxylase] ligase
MEDPFRPIYMKLRSSGSFLASEWPSTGPSPARLGFSRDSEGQFRPEHPVDYLQPDEFCRLSAIPAESVTFLLSTDSTNSLMMERARRLPVHRAVCIAEHQQSGRGRRGRSWLSPFGRSLSISIGYEYQGNALRMQGISLVAGLAVCSVLRRLGGTGCELKWPNDVLVDGRKLCGILVEHQQVEGINKYVIGVGINIELTRDEMASVNQPVCNARQVGVLADRTTVAALVSREILDGLERLGTDGFSAFREPFEKMHALQGKVVSIHRGGDAQEEGVVHGIDSDGTLLVLHEDGLRRYVSGEISVRNTD